MYRCRPAYRPTTEYPTHDDGETLHRNQDNIGRINHTYLHLRDNQLIRGSCRWSQDFIQIQQTSSLITDVRP